MKLSTAKSLKGYKLECLDGEIGKAREFYFDDRYWAVRYLVADTGDWLTDKQVLISPYALVGVIADKGQIVVNLTKKQLEDSPSLETDKPVSRQYEDAYHGHHGWPTYWGGPEMWGTRYVGRDAVRAGYAEVWSTFPDAHWGNARHVVAGDRGVSEWSFTGTRTDGSRVEVNGCDLFTFQDGKIAVKNSYRKNRLAAPVHKI